MRQKTDQIVNQLFISLFIFTYARFSLLVYEHRNQVNINLMNIRNTKNLIVADENSEFAIKLRLF